MSFTQADIKPALLLAGTVGAGIYVLSSKTIAEWRYTPVILSSIPLLFTAIQAPSALAAIDNKAKWNEFIAENAASVASTAAGTVGAAVSAHYRLPVLFGVVVAVGFAVSAEHAVTKALTGVGHVKIADKWRGASARV